MPEMNMMSRSRMADYNTIKPSNYNENHPELREGEYFFMNKPLEEEIGELNDNVVDSYRLGQIAFDNQGRIVEGFQPIFVTFAD